MASLGGFSLKSQMGSSSSTVDGVNGGVTLIDLDKQTTLSGGGGNGRDAPKPLDIVSYGIILSSLRNSGKVAGMASEEDDAPV
ncbi:hypothetical protein HS088_TW17G00912 [Tripterygium wilfordii]|uniref:Uncharacterized protein n=1 Tax=Tripterygium wilfordii TaxID=458696 RepID=A0A7J7CH60_TRIWF|nr:hypothetical protein HS088_TW17G00912 [Tripterygium wilfordii]